MADLVKELNNLSKTEEDLLLEKTGITDTDGELTDEGERLVMQLLAEDNRKKLLEAAKTIQDGRQKAEASPVSVVELQDLQNRVTDLEEDN